MVHDTAWHARILCVLSGALRMWGVSGSVSREADDGDGFVIAPAGGTALRVTHGVAWSLTRCDPHSGAPMLLHYAGLPGLLRGLREELAPDAPTGRLLIGAQQLLARDKEAW